MTTTASDASLLAELGVRASELSADDRLRLDRDGYVLWPGMLDESSLAALRRCFDELIAEEGPRAASEFQQEGGCDRLSDLVNKGAVFDRLWLAPRVLAGVDHVLRRPFKLSSLNARDAKAGEGHQALHTDWSDRTDDDRQAHVANALWVLDGFSADNGATRLIPGTHLAAHGPKTSVADPAAAHPDEIVAACPPGSVLLINAHLWHGGTRNRAGTRRRVMHAYYCAREHRQQLDQKRYLRAETRARLSPPALRLLGI
jgi:hypothetical protein